MTVNHKEIEFENSIEANLLLEGYVKLENKSYNREVGLFKKTLFEFLQKTQNEQIKQLKSQHGTQFEEKFIYRLNQLIDKRGMLYVLRNGITDYGVKIDLVYFKPVTSFNPDAYKKYRGNIFGITRQLKYSTKNENSLDLVLSINGIPVATVEIKTKLTGQNVWNAINQYKGRDPRELLFKFNKRALVHFAVDQDEVYMTTELKGKSTRFLPFNRGKEEEKSAGNSKNPGNYKTSYLWEDIWKTDNWLEIFGRFMHLQKKERIRDGKRVKIKELIFPRYHQLEAVRKLVRHTKKHREGHQYLIQHSAGSGKSNSIAWLAYQLSGLHNESNQLIFDSVVVVTDRKVLDRQLQDTIYQFDHIQGVVQKIDHNSKQLAEALSRGAKIIITTLQKFPVVLDTIEENREKGADISMKKRNYAVIVDEAHSSQTGNRMVKLKRVLSQTPLEEVSEQERQEYTDYEEEIIDQMLSRGKQENLSFYAFTATPKEKTLETFGTKDEDGRYNPFHLYSMRQAIEEGFILDVLKNYTTYGMYLKLQKTALEDPEYEKKKASKAIARFLSLHPYNLSQKTEVIIEHFREFVRKKIDYRAKAMIVTSSRLHVYRYKQAFDKYIRENNCKDIKVLVAFSGAIEDEDFPDKEWTEESINKVKMSELPKKFASQEYNFLIVANKYTTGYDQPLLHTMYVDKKLAGVQAVQTLSRLNRTYPGKDDTFVLDFVNDAELIKEAFQPYYEVSYLEGDSDYNLLTDLKLQLDEKQIYYSSEVELFCETFFKPKSKLSRGDQGKINSVLDYAVERYVGADEEVKEQFKENLISFLRLYAYFSQIIPFQSVDLEKLYAYGRFLIKKLPKDQLLRIPELEGDVALEYYRLVKTHEGDIELDKNSDVGLNPIVSGGTMGKKDEEVITLSSLINKINELFGTDLTENDRLFFEQIKEDFESDGTIAERKNVNTYDNFALGIRDELERRLVKRRKQNLKIFNEIMKNDEFKAFMADYFAKTLYYTT